MESWPKRFDTEVAATNYVPNMTLQLRPATGVGFVCLLLGAAFVSHAGERTERVSVIRVPAAGQSVKARLGVDGAIHLLCDSTEGPRYVKSQDDGRTFSQPLAIVDAASQKPGLLFQAADLAIGQDGRVHVAMGNNAWKLKLPQEEWSLYYTTLAPGAKTFAPVRNLNRKSSEGFSLAADARGTVTALFLSGKVFAMVSSDNGETFTASTEPNPAWNPCECCTTSAAYGADGRLAVIYREKTDDERDIFVGIWDQHGAAKPLHSRISGTPWKIAGCPMTYFTISRAGTGYVAAWPTKGQVCFARLDKDGGVLPPGEIRTPGTTGMRDGLVALSAADGVTLVAWKDRDILGWQLYDVKGQPQGTPSSANSPGNGGAGVVLPDGRFLVFP